MTNPTYEDLDKAIIKCVREFTEGKGYAATTRDIQRLLREHGVHRGASGSVSTSVILYHVRRLADTGRLRYTPGLTRSITLPAARAK